MKKSLFIFAAAALVLAGCNNDVTLDENQAPVDPTAQREISFKALSSTPKRVQGRRNVSVAFPTGQAMYVAAYDATPGVAADYFGQTTFVEDGGVWKANPKKYWPIIESGTTTLNFLAYTGVPKGDNYFNATHPAQSLTIALADNTTNQYDLMYACGRGTRAAGATPSNVAMTFKHALAVIKFNVTTAADYSYGEPKVYPLVLDSIKLVDAKYSGTYTITHTGWNDNDNDPQAQSVSGVWDVTSAVVANVIREPGFDHLTTTPQQVGDSILVVPDADNTSADWLSFIIYYKLDGTSYTYTYAPAAASSRNLDQAKKYTFNITLTLNEIIIAPTVTDYEAVNNDVDVK